MARYPWPHLGHNAQHAKKYINTYNRQKQKTKKKIKNVYLHLQPNDRQTAQRVLKNFSK